jgi:hypothetical protein
MLPDASVQPALRLKPEPFVYVVDASYVTPVLAFVTDVLRSPDVLLPSALRVKLPVRDALPFCPL